MGPIPALLLAASLTGGAMAQSFDDAGTADVEQPPTADSGATLNSGDPPPPSVPSFRDCTFCPEMVEIPAGSFVMGSPESELDRQDDEGPQHSVSVGRFALGRYEVTFSEWEACVAAGGCSHRPDDWGWGRGSMPVMDVSWEDAQQYVAWLSRSTGHEYRLPSESEWEYAARAGTTTARYWGEEIGSGWAHCRGCGSPWDDSRTAPVGSFSANGFGLHDMLGNVWEWTQDCYSSSYAGAPTTGVAWESGECNLRVVRGGSRSTDSPTSADRGPFELDTRARNGGFRVVRTF